jgi:hypothetical protein
MFTGYSNVLKACAVLTTNNAPGRILFNTALKISLFSFPVLPTNAATYTTSKLLRHVCSRPAFSHLKTMDVSGIARWRHRLEARLIASWLESMLKIEMDWAWEVVCSWERMQREVRGSGPQPRKAKRLGGFEGLQSVIALSSTLVRST